jgi:hypothetical protein
MKVISLLALLGIVACGSPAAPTESKNAIHDEPNCESTIDTKSPLCDAQHSQVVTCEVPEAIPSYVTCVQATGVDRGLVWCCEP